MFEKSFLENIIANAPLGIITTDLHGRITFINRVACKIHREEDALELVRRHVSFVMQDDRDEFMFEFNKILYGEKQKATCRYSVRSDRENAFVRATMTILRDEYYKPVGVLIMCEDVTQEKTLRDKLVKEKLFSESVIETANMLIVGIRPDGKIMLFNHAAEQMTGYCREEALGKDWFEMFTPEENRPDIKKVFYSIIDGKAPVYQEYSVLTRTGESRLMGWHSTYLSETGRPAGVIAIGEDITERRKLEENLMNEQERLDVILRNLGAGLITVNKDYEITYANALIKEYFGKCEGERCFIAFEGMLARGKKGEVCPECPVCEVLERNVERAMTEIRGRNKGGDEFWFQLIATPVRNSEGDLVGALELVVPIDERKTLEEQLIQAQKMEAVGILAGGVAHDFNNILGAVLGYSSLVKSRMDKTDENYVYINMIESASRRASDLAERLLSFSRRAKKKTSPVSVNQLVKNVLALLRSSIRNNIKVRTNLARTSPTVVGDKTQLEQLVMNIIINARDAMPGGGVLEISTGKTSLKEEFCKTHLGAHPGQNAVISISDTGMGMDEKTRKQIFEPFFTTKREGEGTGLGLSIAYSVARNHKGYIDVESQKSRGTIFRVFLPASKRPAVRRPEKPKKPPHAEETILVVDDEDVIRTMLKDVLSSLGYQVIVANGGNEAIDIFRKSFEKIDFAIIDMIMPDKSGRKTFEEMRRIKPDLKAIISAGKPVKEAEELKCDGIAGFLRKPYNFKELSETIRRIIGP